jgi:hypothetical protein
MFANGVGILSIGVEARDIPYSSALWVNEMMRKIYPSSGRQIETARIPSLITLVKETSTHREIVAEERWDLDLEKGYRPPLSRILLSLLHFANYMHEEFEIALDERMIVNSFVSLDRTSVLPEYESSEDYEIAFSRLLYVDRAGPDFRYNPSFLHEQMKKCVYRRWQHDGTLYGTTAYSNVTSVLRSPEDSGSEEIVHRMFSSKHLLLAVIALFYRTSLLDFAKESALVSRQLLPIFTGKTVRHRHILLATRLMADFHYFNNYWFHPEPTTKDEELEHFALLCNAYQLAAARETIEDRVDKLAGYIDRLFALRNSDAVNRLAMMSVILGIGALVTGYFGMNIPHLETILHSNAVSLSTLVLTSLMAVASLWFVVYIIVSNWLDYRASIFPHRYRRPLAAKSLRRLRSYGAEREQGPSEESPQSLTPQD